MEKIAFFLVIAITQVASHIHLSTVCHSKKISDGHTVERIISGNTVEVALWNITDGTRQTCFKPSQEYYVTISVVSASSNAYIKGLLMTSNFGTFPDEKVRLMPDGTHRIRHDNCKRVSKSGKAAGTYSNTRHTQHAEKEFEFGYTAPRSQKEIQFNYSVVFGYADYIENEATVFHSCSEEPTFTTSIPIPTPTTSIPTPTPTIITSTTTTPIPTSVVPTSSPTPSPNCHSCFEPSKPLSCPKSKEHYTVLRELNADGKHYNCVIKEPLRNFTCQSSCEKRLQCDGDDCPVSATVECSLSMTPAKSRKFNCTADDDSDFRVVEFPVDVQHGCKCKAVNWSYNS